MVFEETVVLDKPFDEVVEQVKAAFADQGFGALTEIDLQETLRAKIGRSMDRYLIVGACNPHLASRALDAEPQIGALLPCNVVIRQGPEGVIVEAMDPGVMATLAESVDVEPIATEARRLVGNAMERLATAG